MESATKEKRPQVLLLGNGLNYGHGGRSWKELLRSIRSNERISDSEELNCPMPLQVIIVTDDNIDDTLKKHNNVS